MEIKRRQLVQEWLGQKHFPSEATIIDGPQPGWLLVFVPATSVGQKKSKGKTSNRQMAHLKRIARRDLAIDLEFQVTAGEREADIEAGLCALLREILLKPEAKAFLTSAPNGRTDVWIDIPAPNAQLLVNNVNKLLGDYLNKVGLSLHQIYWQGSLIPSSVSVLRAVKILGPTSADKIASYLEGKGYPSIPGRWLKSQLDNLRRRGFLVWYDDKYVITDSGLTLMPRSRGRTGSDVERALVLGRRHW